MSIFEVFLVFLSRIGTEYGDLLCKSADLLCKSLYSVQTQENMDQENSEYAHVLHSVYFLIVEELSVKTEILQLESCCRQAFYKFNFSETSSETSVVEPIVALQNAGLSFYWLHRVCLPENSWKFAETFLSKHPSWLFLN